MTSETQHYAPRPDAIETEAKEIGTKYTQKCEDRGQCRTSCRTATAAGALQLCQFTREHTRRCWICCVHPCSRAPPTAGTVERCERFCVFPRALPICRRVLELNSS